ncbi:MAG TPA: BppU family phage baseplate upper protein [Spirillospora sp.]|nr:BppU family phage baseplate upper protein [Spirillospora sp.]
MTTSIEFKRGDTAPALSATLYADDAGATPLDLTGATVKLIMATTASEPGNPKVNAACQLVDAAAGQVSYSWLPTDVDTAAKYQAEFEVTWADGTIQTFPRDGYLTITLLEDLD